MLHIYQTVLYFGIIIILSFTVYGIFKKKGITIFLYSLFTIAFWFTIIFTVISIAFDIFTEDGTVRTSKSSTFYMNTKNVPVRIHLTFNSGKKYSTTKKDSVGGAFKDISITRYSYKNRINDEKIFLEESGLTKQQLDSIFEFSNDLKTIGKTLQFNRSANSELSTNTENIITNTYINLKTENWVLSTVIFINTYLLKIVLIFIFFQLKSLFKLLDKNVSFSLKLIKKINWIAILLMIWQIITLLFSIIFSLYYNYIGFGRNNNNHHIHLNIYPRLSIDFTIIIVALGLLVLSKLLKRAYHIQSENDLTI